MASRTIFDCDSCKKSDITPLSFSIVVGPRPVVASGEPRPVDSGEYIRHVDICQVCAENLLKTMMAGLTPEMGLATYKAITRDR